MIELQIINTAMLKESALFDLMQFNANIFTDRRCQIMYKIIEQLHGQDRKIDFPAVMSEIKRQDLFEKVGGQRIYSDIASLPVVVDHMSMLRDLETERRKAEIKIHASGFLNKRITIDEFIESVTPLFESTIDIDDECIDVGEYAQGNLDDIFHDGVSVDTGIDILDKKIGGLFIGDLIIIAARPGEGKTTLALQIANTIADNVLFFSFEMKRPQILAKLISALTKIPAMKIMKKTMNDSEIPKAMKAMGKIEKYNVTLFDGSDSFPKVLSKMRKYIKKKKSKVIIVDYLQLMTGAKGENKNARIENMTRGMKNLAMREGIPIVALSQLSREVEKQNREPILSDLRDSGAIEQDASTVLFIHEGNIIVGKSRLGPTGKISGLYFDRENSRFTEERQAWQDCRPYGEN